MEELHEAKDKWFYIGMNLKVSVSSLNGIEYDQHNISVTARCCRSGLRMVMIEAGKLWLKLLGENQLVIEL